MDLKDSVTAPAMAVPADVSVTPEDVLADVPEPKHLALLVTFPLDLRVPDLLDVERSGLHHDAAYRKDRAHKPDHPDVGRYPVLHGRCEPALVL